MNPLARQLPGALRHLRVRYLWARLTQRRHFDEVRAFCLFIGYPRSGHSIVGAQLNAHRAAVIAHESDAPAHILAGASRDELFARLLARAAWFKSRGHRSNYDYAIAHPWQGRFETLQVLGDKRGGAVSRALAEHPDLLDRTRALVRVPLRLIHVVRNPYDNIAAIARWHALSLADSVDFYFRHADAVAAAASQLDPSELHTVRHEDMIADPRAALAGLLRHLDLADYPGYRDACAAAVFTAPTRTRHTAAWTTAERRAIEQRMRGRPFLEGYTFAEPPAPAVHFPPPAAAPFAAVPELVLAAARHTPAAPALIAADRTWSYAELEAQAWRVAAALRHAALPRDAVIAIAGPRSFDVVAALLGVWLNRQVMLPLADDLPAARRAYMLQAARAALLLHAGPCPDLEFAGPRLDLHHLPPAAPASPEPDEPASPRAPDEPAYLFFTSGTTGRPKGIRGTHGGLAHFLAWQRATFALAPDDRIAQLTSLSFDVVLRDLFLALTSGAALCLPPPDLEPAHPWPWFAAAGITRLHAVPSLAAHWLDRAAAPLPRLRTVFFAGEPLPAALVQRWRAVAGPGHELINLYGPTETTLAKCWYRVPDPPAPGVQPVGQPLPETEVLVLDEAGQPCADGVAGELVIRTPHRTLGYLDDSFGPGRGFVTNPLTRDPADLVYCTGDRGARRADGLLEVHGRRDDQVKILGVRIEPAEIAAALLTHPAVRQAHVSARPGPPPRLLAYVAAAPGVVTERELRAYLAGLLPTAMIPHQFILLPQLPLMPNGKVDRAALPAPATLCGAVPAGESAQALAALWQAVLGGNPIPAGAHFFACGGDSLRAAQLAHRVRAQFGVVFSLRQVFAHPVLEDQADALARCPPAASAGEVRPPAPAGLPALTAAQQRLWFMSRLAPGQGVHNIPGSLRLRGTLDPARLSAALAALTARHPALRTRFIEQDGQPLPMEDAHASWSLEHVDLANRPAELDAVAQAFVQRPFDLARAPLARALLMRLADDDHVLVYAFHHAIADGWSNLRFNRALREAYAGPASAAPPLPLPDLAAREQAQLARHGAAARAYWRARLAAAPAVLALPADRPYPATPSYRRASCARLVPAPLVAALDAAARAGHGTVCMHLLAALNLLLHQLTGARDLLVAIPVAGRDDPALDDVLACLVNTVIVRTAVDAGDPPAVVLDRTRTATLEALDHATLPFEQVVQAVHPARDPRWHPLSQVLFNHLVLDDGHTTAPGLTLEREWRVDAITPFDLALYARQQGAVLQLHLVYNTDLFDAPRVEHGLTRYLDLLATVVARHAAPLDAAPRLPAPARPEPPSAAAAAAEEIVDAALEEQLALLWGEVLGRDGVGRTDDFFALGGHSLLAAQLATRIQAALGRTLPLRTLFELPTVAGQAAFLARGQTARLPPLAAGAFDALSLDQQHLWQLHAAGTDRHFYNVTRAVRIEGDLQPTLFRIAIHRILQRHAVLRSGYAAGPAGPHAIPLPVTHDPLAVVDLRQLPAGEQERAEQALLVRETRQHFDLGRDIPIRFLLVQRADDRCLLVMTAHHIAVDCWSMGLPFQDLRRADDPWHLGILLRELLATYEDVRLGRPSSLPVLPIQFTDFAHWQQARLRDGSFAAQSDYWRGQLGDAPRAVALPADFPRPPRPTLAGARLEFDLPPDLAPALDRYRRRQRTTRLAPLLAAYALALRRWSGQADLVIGMPVGNRTHPETPHLIGPAAGALPLRVRVVDSARGSDLVRQVWTTLQQAVAHQDYPFAQLVRDLGPWPADRAPVFQVRFALQQSPALPPPAPALRVTPVKIDRGIAKFDLSLVLAEQGDQLRGWCEYNGDLFQPATAAAFAASFVALATRLFHEPDRTVSDLLAAPAPESHEQPAVPQPV